MAGYIGSKASVVSSGAEHKKVFDITTTTTSLTGLVYTPTLVHVFHNGWKSYSQRQRQDSDSEEDRRRYVEGKYSDFIEH